MHALDRCAAGRGDLVDQCHRVLAGFLAELRRTERRLAGDFLRERTGKPRLHARGGKRVDVYLHERARSSPKRGKCGKLRFGNIIDLAHRAEHRAHKLHLFRAARCIRADGACRAQDLRADIGHDAHKGHVFSKIGCIEREALACRNGHDELVGMNRAFDRL